MIVVSNTSPLTNLAAIGHFDLLRKLFGEIHIAHGVWATLRGHPGTEIAVQIPAAYHLHGGIAMRTTLNLDDEALTSALKTSPGKTKTDVINEALREYARRRRLQEFLEFEGKMHWEGDLDQLRGRSPEMR